jgi:hypothetical protein
MMPSSMEEGQDEEGREGLVPVEVEAVIATIAMTGVGWEGWGEGWAWGAAAATAAAMAWWEEEEGWGEGWGEG